MSDSKVNYDLEPDDNESMTTLVATNQTNEQQSTASIVQAQSKEIAELKVVLTFKILSFTLNL